MHMFGGQAGQWTDADTIVPFDGNRSAYAICQCANEWTLLLR